MLSDEEHRIEGGAQARDMAPLSTWRETTDDRVLHALDLYGSLLIGQTNGMNDSLSLPALESALRLDAVPEDARREVASRLLMVHQRAVEVYKMRHRKNNG